MMLEKYRRRVSGIDNVVARQVAEMLRISCRRIGKDALFRMLQESGHCQADLVLCLLRLNTPQSLKHAERLVGRRITHCPPAFKWKPLPVHDSDRSIDDRRVLAVTGTPTLQSGRRPWLRRWHLFQVGATVTQLLARGATRRDLRLATKRGWVQLSGA